MHTSTTLTRFRRLLVVGAVVAGAIVPAAAAVGRPPDVQDAASSNLDRAAEPAGCPRRRTPNADSSPGRARALRRDPPLRDSPAAGKPRGDAAPGRSGRRGRLLRHRPRRDRTVCLGTPVRRRPPAASIGSAATRRNRRRPDRAVQLTPRQRIDQRLQLGRLGNRHRKRPRHGTHPRRRPRHQPPSSAARSHRLTFASASQPNGPSGARSVWTA